MRAVTINAPQTVIVEASGTGDNAVRLTSTNESTSKSPESLWFAALEYPLLPPVNASGKLLNSGPEPKSIVSSGEAMNEIGSVAMPSKIAPPLVALFDSDGDDPEPAAEDEEGFELYEPEAAEVA